MFSFQTLLLEDGDSIFNALLIILFSSRFHSTSCWCNWQELMFALVLFIYIGFSCDLSSPSARLPLFYLILNLHLAFSFSFFTLVLFS